MMNEERIYEILRDILNNTQTIKDDLEEKEKTTITLKEFLNREEFEDIIRSNEIKLITIKIPSSKM